MAPAEGIARLGFKRWYERQLVEGHAYLVTCFLCMIVVAALIEEISFKDGGTRPLMMLLVLFAAGAVGVFAWGRYRVILALAEQMRDQREEATREHVAETRGWLQQWQSNRERLDQYDAALIPLASERTRASIATYRGGSGPLAFVLEARRMEIDTRMERLRVEMETAALWAQLEYLIPAEHLASAANRIDAPKESQR